MSQSPGKQFSGSSINRQASALRRTKIRKNLLGKFGNHLTYNPGLVIKEDSQETQASGKKDGSPQGLGSSKTGNSSVKDLLTLYEDGSRDRLAMNYYGNENKIQLWQRKLYEPPTTAQNDHIEKLVAEEFSLETWCYEVANDTTEIHMVSYHLNEVPRPIVFMGHLTKLNLSWNNLTSIPYEIGLLANLTELNLSFNRLTSLPPELGQEVDRDPMGNVVQVSKFAVGGMLQLKFIDVSNNAIAEIPHTLSRLADLNSFAFDHNELKLLPEG